MKMTYQKSEMYVESEKKDPGEPYRSQAISDTYGMGKPTRTNPVGGFMAMQCFSGSPDQRKSPTSKPGNAGGKRII
jgi:hypothetical protein